MGSCPVRHPSFDKQGSVQVGHLSRSNNNQAISSHRLRKDQMVDNTESKLSLNDSDQVIQETDMPCYDVSSVVSVKNLRIMHAKVPIRVKNTENDQRQ